VQILAAFFIDERAASQTSSGARLPAVEFRPRAVKDALTPELGTPTAKVVWVLRAGLAGLALHSLAVEPVYTTKPLLFVSASWGLLMSFLFAFIPTQRPRTLKTAEAATLFAISMHVIGHVFGLYQHYVWYDTLLHFSMPLVTVLILYALSQATNWIWNWRAVTVVEVAIYLFAMSVTLGVVWEIVEFGMDQLFGTKEQDDLFDTMLDLIMDVGGALVGAVAAGWATHVGRTRGFDRISEEPKRPYPMRAPRGASKE